MWLLRKLMAPSMAALALACSIGSTGCRSGSQPQPPPAPPTTSPPVRLEGLKLAAHGPNCWNSALIKAGLLRFPRHVTKPEFWFWMNSRFCRTVPSTETPSQGDIGSLFWKRWGNYHSFVYIDSDTVFSKNGPDPAETYRTQRYEEMFYPKYRQMAKACRGPESLAENKPECELKVVYHRCASVPDDFYSRYPELRPIEQSILQVESDFEKWLRSPGPELLPAIENGIRLLGDSLRELRTRRDSGDLEFARQALEYRVIGLLDSDSFAGISAASSKIIEAADRIQQNERSHVPDAPSRVSRH